MVGVTTGATEEELQLYNSETVRDNSETSISLMGVLKAQSSRLFFSMSGQRHSKS